MSSSFFSLGDKQIQVLKQYYDEFRQWKELDHIFKERLTRQGELQRILSKDKIDNISTDEINHACTLLWSVDKRFAGELTKNNEISKIRKTFKYLLYGNDYIFTRFEKVISDPEYRLKTFGVSRISELLSKVQSDLRVSFVNEWTERLVKRLGIRLEYDEKNLAEKARTHDNFVNTIREKLSFRNLDEVDLFIWFIDQFPKLFPDKRDPLQGFTGPESNMPKELKRRTREETTFEQENQTAPKESSVFEKNRRVLEDEFVPSEEAVRPSAHATDDKWVLEDTLGYKPYAVGIYTFLTHRQTKPPLTIGIQAPWGGGKTSIMRMVQKDLDPDGPGLTKEEEKKPQKKITVKECSPKSKSEKPFTISGQKPKMLTIWFNAWKYQNSEQIWAGLADAIISQFAQRLEPEGQKRFLLELNLSRAGKDKFQQKVNKQVKSLLWDKVRKRLWAYLTGIGASAIWFTIEQTGVLGTMANLYGDAVAIVPILVIALLIMIQRNEAASAADDKEADDVLGELVQVPDYRMGLGFIHHVNADMKQVLEIIREYDKDMKLAIFIDDLDRCSPSNVADVFEGLNMFISAEFTNCFFIIGMDVEIVTAALEKAHSEIIEKMPLYSRRTAIGWRFMDKFVQMPIIIPPPEPSYVQTYTAGLFKTDLPDALRINVKQLITNLGPNVDDAKWEDFFQSVKSVDKRDYAPQEQAALRTEFEIAKNVIKTTELVKNIEKAKEEYSDQNPEVRDQVAKAVIDFSNNPREMKRFLNVLRFNYFLRDGRIRSHLRAPTPDQLRHWIVLTMKWPQVVLWLHRSSSGISYDKSAGNQTRDKLKILDEYSKKSMAEWRRKLGELLQIHPGENSVNWIDDENLKNFFADENGKLSDAAETGLY